MGETVGIHLIWTTYGTWLPGDTRGHWSPLFDLYGRLRRPGDQLNPPDAITLARSRELMTEPPKILASDEPDIIADTLARHLAPASAGAPAAPTGGTPRAFACAIEPTHLHLLITPPREPLHRFVGRLKGTTSSALLRHPDNWGRSRIWTADYWKRFLFDDDGTRAVRRYIEAHNERRNLPPRPYPWLIPTP